MLRATNLLAGGLQRVGGDVTGNSAVNGTAEIFSEP